MHFKTQNHFYVFQCLHKIKSTQTTAHIFAHHCKIKTLQVFKHLTDWVLKHLDWIKTVRSKILNAKHIRVKDYTNDINSGLVLSRFLIFNQLRLLSS